MPPSPWFPFDRIRLPDPHHLLRSRTAWALAAAGILAGSILMLSDGPSIEALPIAQAAETRPAVASASPAGAGSETGQAAGVAIDRTAALVLTRAVLTSVHQANATGNYTVLRDLGAPGFQAANTAANLSEIFAGLRGSGIDLSPGLAAEPQLASQPEIGPDGMARVAGTAAATPFPVAFELTFAQVEGRWMPFAISIAVVQPEKSLPAASQPVAALPADQPVTTGSISGPRERRPDEKGARPPGTAAKQRALQAPLPSR